MRHISSFSPARAFAFGAILLGSALLPRTVQAAGPALPDLQVTARAGDPSGSGGAVLTGNLALFTFTIENKGKAQATAATFTATLPAGLTLLDDPAYGPNAYFKVASVGFQFLYDTAADGQPHSTCTVTPEADGSKTISCRLGQQSGFFNPNILDGLDILDAGLTNIVQFFAWTPATPGTIVMTGNASTNNGDSKPANNVVAVTLEVK